MRLAWVLSVTLINSVLVAGALEARPRKSVPRLRTPAAQRQEQIERGRRFLAIAERRLPGQHIVYRDREVTAFLDQKDPQSPVHDPKIFDWEMDAYPDLKRLPPERRAHILVIPNHWRQHVGLNLGSGLRAQDLEVSLRVLRKAEGLAREMGLLRPRIFINPPDKISVAYLHVHIIGERDPDRPYPHVADQ